MICIFVRVLECKILIDFIQGNIRRINENKVSWTRYVLYITLTAIGMAPNYVADENSRQLLVSVRWPNILLLFRNPGSTL